jgi:hypothetical protein
VSDASDDREEAEGDDEECETTNGVPRSMSKAILTARKRSVNTVCRSFFTPVCDLPGGFVGNLSLPATPVEKEGRMRMCLAVLSAVLAAAGAVACNSNSTSTLPAVAATPVYTTDTFNGTVNVLGFDVQPFTVAISGNITVTLTAAGPPSTVTMGVFVGSPATAGSTTCLALSGATASGPASPTPLLSGQLVAGPYCVQIFDIGQQTGPISYTLTVNHS